MRAGSLALVSFAAGAFAAGGTDAPVLAHSTGTSLPNITTTSYDELSQTIVTATVPATPISARASCDAAGNCALPPSCVVSFPGYISCSGQPSSASQHVNPGTASSSAATFHTTTSTTALAFISDTKMLTATSSAAAAKRSMPLNVLTAIWPGISKSVTSPSTPTSTLAGCTSSHAASFGIRATPVSDASPRVLPGDEEGPDTGITLHLADGMLRESNGFVAHFTTTGELEFSSVVAADAPSAYGWSTCDDGLLAHESSKLFCACKVNAQSQIFKYTPACDRPTCEHVHLSFSMLAETAPAVETVAPALRELEERQDLSRLIAELQSVAAASEAADLSSLVSVAMATPMMGKRQEVVATVTTIFTATVTEPRQSYNASEYPTSVTNFTSGMTITNPLRPGWASIVSDPSAAFSYFNNTSIDTGVYLNISTFVAPQFSSISQTEVTTTSDSDSPTDRGTVTSTKVIEPSTTDASSTGWMQFAPVATTNIGGKQNSSAMVSAELPGTNSFVGAAVAIFGLCLGVAVLL